MMEGTLRHERSAPEDYTLVHSPKNWNPWAWIRVIGGPKDTVCENCDESKKSHSQDGHCVGLHGTPMQTVWKPKTASLSVKVKRTDEGVVVDIFRTEHEDEDPIASTFAFFSELPTRATRGVEELA